MSSRTNRSGRVTAMMMFVCFGAVVPALSGPSASAATCPQIGSELASQNDAVQQMLRRTGYCMKQIASHPDSVKSRTEADWTKLCEQGPKATYVSIADNRDWMLRACTPRGSSD